MANTTSEFTYTRDGYGCIGDTYKSGSSVYYIKLSNYPGWKHYPKKGDTVKLEQRDFSANGLSQYCTAWINGELVWKWTKKWQAEMNGETEAWLDKRKKEIRGY